MLNFKIFFVSVGGGDPTDDFLVRFKDIPRIIKKVSESEIGKVQRMPVVDKSSGERGNHILGQQDSLALQGLRGS